MGNLLKSKMVWGAVVAACGWILSQPHIQITDLLQAIGGVIAVLGTRDAIRKSAAPGSKEDPWVAATPESTIAHPHSNR